MSPEIWGKYAWIFLHFVTFDYPENPTELDKQHYYEYFYALQFVLPCAKCRYNLSHHLKKYPLSEEVLSNRTNLVKWGIDLHNIVNYYTGKPMMTYVEAMNEINKYEKTDQNSGNQLLYLLLVLIAFIIVCYLVYYLFKNKKLNI